MAAARFVEQMANRSLGRYAIAVIGDEPRLAYNRVLLSSVLAGEATSEEIELKPAQWWRDHGVTLTYGCRATRVDMAQRQVHLADGRNVPFGKLVIATGSSAIRLGVPGAELPGVHTFRDSADVNELIELGRRKRRTVVVGGGLLGLEAAYGLAKAGSKVTLIHLMDKLMERQLDAPAAALLKRLVEAKGIEIVLNASTKSIVGVDQVDGLELADGRTIAADAVIFAAGIRPNAALAREAGVPCNRGIVVDDQLRTSIEGIYALGECAEHRGTCYGLVEPAYEQARVLADHLASGNASYNGSVLATNLKVSGVSVFSVGDFNAAEGGDVVTFNDSRRGIYKKLVIAGGALTGAVLVGDTQDALWYLDLVKSRTQIADMRNDLMFGQSIAQMKAA
jgi:nitrite reductase (NADH) large subunit